MPRGNQRAAAEACGCRCRNNWNSTLIDRVSAERRARKVNTIKNKLRDTLTEGNNGKENTDGTHVFLIVWKTYRALLARAEASIKRIDLCDSDFRVLEALLHKGPLPVNVIGQKVDLTTGSITSAIDRLEEKLLVVRRNHPEDRRIRIVELTTRGRRLIEKAYAQHRLDMEDAVQGLSREERLIVITLLKRLGKASEDGCAGISQVTRPNL